MSMVQGTQSGTPAADLSALLQLAATQQGSTKALDVKDLEESLNALRSFLAAGGDSLLPDLEEPSSKSSTTVSLSGLTMSGLSLETLLDAVGFEQRRTETKAGMASLEARAQERAMANDEKLKSIQEQLEKAKSQSFLDGLLKAFKYIGMALAAIGSVAMIAAGSVGLAAGGSGAALIAVGANLLVDNGTLIAQALGVPESVIALTFVALGTSLPELVTAITSLIKGHSDLSVGNVVGANVFNLVLVSGVSVTLAPFTIPQSSTLFGVNSSLVLDLPVMLAVMLIMTVPALVKGKMNRAQGIILLAIYAAFCAIQFTM